MSRSILLFFTLIANGRAIPWGGAVETRSSIATVKSEAVFPAPTSTMEEDLALYNLYRRDSYPVSLCGWIGGIGTMPAWCSSQSSCVWNTDNFFVGCCATASSDCAFYTSCVDVNSPKPTADSPDVYTCQGTSVCYVNSYPQGFSQYGCGYSNWATTILTSYSGINTQLSLQIVFTGADSSTSSAITSQPTVFLTVTESVTTSPTSTAILSTSTAIQADSSTSEIVQTSSSALSSTGGSVTSPDSTSPPSASSSSAPGNSSTPAGAIAGGTVGGVAAIAGIVALYFCFGRSSRSKKEGAARPPISPYPDSPPTIAELETPKQPSSFFGTLTETSSALGSNTVPSAGAVPSHSQGSERAELAGDSNYTPYELEARQP